MDASLRVFSSFNIKLKYYCYSVRGLPDEAKYGKSFMNSSLAMLYALMCRDSNVLVLWHSRLFLSYIDGLVEYCSDSSALAVELLQSCTKPPICAYELTTCYGTLGLIYCLHCWRYVFFNPKKGTFKLCFYVGALPCAWRFGMLRSLWRA